MLVEFDRPVSGLHLVADGEDDGLEQQRAAAKIKINPVHVGAVFASRHDGITIVRLADGRGFRILGTFAEVCEKLEANGHSQE